MKPSFDGNALDTYKSMGRYNPGIISQLSNDDIIKQISEISNKKDDIVNFLKESGEDELAKILGDRIDDLKRIEDEINLASLTGSLKVQKKMSNVLPRNLKSEKDMYGNIEEEKTGEIWKNYKSKASSDMDALCEVGTNGWAVLSELCDIRGFNARPNVVTPDDFWKFAANAKNPVMYRGQQGELEEKLEKLSTMNLGFQTLVFTVIGGYGVKVFMLTWMTTMEKNLKK